MRIALVTGASRGIGAAIAAQLASDCKVLTPSRAELDLGSEQSLESYLAGLDQPIDILINDAGINRIAMLENIENKDLDDTLQINLLAPFRLIQFVAPQMKARNYGRIVNISSLLSVVSRAGRTSYSMSKTALNGMTRSLAVELAPYNILVNAVAPGYVMTDLTRQNNSATEIDKISQTIPIQRLAAPQEIASVVAFLCSEQNTYLTGQTIVVDGGYTCL
ncbi:MAG: SDR family oxidoreductase [Anaerolineales bacterium]|nr:SDR family oxidoreductase [Anaerolineales bacterium]